MISFSSFWQVALLLVACIFMLVFWARRNRAKTDYTYDSEKGDRGFNSTELTAVASRPVGVDEVWITKHVSELLPKVILYTFAHKVALLEDDLDWRLINSLSDSMGRLNPEQQVSVDDVKIENYTVESSANTSTILVTATCNVSLTLELGEQRIGIQNYNTPHRSEVKMCFERRIRELGSHYRLVDFFIIG